jgi:hypothetical protein
MDDSPRRLNFQNAEIRTIVGAKQNAPGSVCHRARSSFDLSGLSG